MCSFLRGVLNNRLFQLASLSRSLTSSELWCLTLKNIEHIPFQLFSHRMLGLSWIICCWQLRRPMTWNPTVTILYQCIIRCRSMQLNLCGRIVVSSGCYVELLSDRWYQTRYHTRYPLLIVKTADDEVSVSYSYILLIASLACGTFYVCVRCLTWPFSCAYA